MAYDPTILSDARRLFWWALAARLAVVGLVAMTGRAEAFVLGDSPLYLELSRALWMDGAFTAGGTPHVMRPPGYPFLLASAWATPWPVATMILVQAVAGSATVAVVTLMGAELGGRAAGRYAGLLCLLEPGLLFWGARLLPDITFALPVTLMAWVAMRASTLEGRELRRAAVAGALAAITAFIKVIGYFAAPWLALTWLLVRRGSAGRRLAEVAVLLVAAATLLGSWHLRNIATAGYAGFATQIDRAVLMSAVAGIEAQRRGLDYGTARRLVWRESARHGCRDRGDERDCNVLPAAGVILRHPLQLAATRVRGALIVALMPDRGVPLVITGADREMPTFIAAALVLGQWRQAAERILSLRTSIVRDMLALGILLAAYWLLAARGILALRDRRAVALLAVIVYFALFAAGPPAEARFRCAFMPIVCLLAGVGLQAWIRPTSGSAV